MKQEQSFLISNILLKARFKFALKCLQTVMQIKKTENVVFSPYSMYEGLLLVYFASTDHTEEHLKHLLYLSDVSKDDLIHYYISEKDFKLQSKFQNEEMFNQHNDENYCWIGKTKVIKNLVKLLFKNKYKICDFSESFSLMHSINNWLKRNMQSYIHQSVKLNKINEYMQCILSNICCFKGEEVLLDHAPNALMQCNIDCQPKTLFLDKVCKMFMSELPYTKDQSLFLLFPTAKSNSDVWEMSKDVFGLIQRLMTKKGSEQLRKVLDGINDEVLLLPTIIYPESFELENELPIDRLLETLGIQKLLDPYISEKHCISSSMCGFTIQNTHFGGSMHRAYIKVIPRKSVTAGAVTMFFTKNELLFQSNVETDRSKCKNSFIWLIYDKYSHNILFTGVINDLFSSISRDDIKSPFEKSVAYIRRISQSFRNCYQAVINFFTR